MDYKGKKILILEGYARQCLPFMRSFKKHGCEVTVLCNSKIDLGYASRFPDHKIIGICDPDRYVESEKYICDLIRKGKYDLVLPLVDFSAKILSDNKMELSQYSAIASNTKGVFDISQDKLSVMKICMDNNIPCPKTLTDIHSVDDIKLSYPIVVKPRRGCGAKGFHCFQTMDELRAFVRESNVDLSEYVVQEYIEQTNCNLSSNIFIDDNGRIKSAFVYQSKRWYPLKGGTGTFNQLVERQDAIESSKKLADILQLRGWFGVDFIEDPITKQAKVIEVNPRILACAKIGFVAGIDMALPVLQKEFGAIVENQVVKKHNVCVRMSQTDILWFIKSPDRFRTNPSWFKLAKDQTFSLDDPLPWFSFLLRGLIRLEREESQRK